MRLQSFLFFVCLALAGANVTRNGGPTCDCGFVDAKTGNIYGEALIVLFNETSWPSPGLLGLEYNHTREKGWNSVYRQGAALSNVEHNFNSSALELFLNPPTPQRLSSGAAIRTERQDIQYGTFRASLKPPSQQTGGSAISMALEYNDTQSIEVMLTNHNNLTKAWAATLVNGEWPNRNLGVNFSVLNKHAKDIGIQSPWDFNQYKIDWTPNAINFTIGNNVTRQIHKSQRKDLPTTSKTLKIKHWSTGNKFLMYGPPTTTAVAGIEWIRIFFNASSTVSDLTSRYANGQCSASLACSVDDTSLRGMTKYGDQSTLRYKEPKSPYKKRLMAIVVLAVCITISAGLLSHELYLWKPWARGSKVRNGPKQDTFDSTSAHSEPTIHVEGDSTRSSIDSESRKSALRPDSDRPVSSTDTLRESLDITDSTSVESKCNIPFDSESSIKRASQSTTPCDQFSLTKDADLGDEDGPLEKKVGFDSSETGKGATGVEIKEISSKDQESQASPQVVLEPRRKRVDYLAGMVAVTAIIVTVMHFCLTFVPGVVVPVVAPDPSLFHHPSVEVWILRTLSPLFFNQIWLGVFFTTSSRFLCDRYFEDGNLRHVAAMAVRRIPRFMVPVTIVVTLEYFFIDAGAVYYAEYLASITWSDWPYVTRFTSFGNFVSELLQLMYLIPNDQPQITFHYCTGVLWTIAVQLQSTWLILLASVVIREMKTPWKRMLFYAAAIISHWYAISWGSYFYFGILLADLDVTYNYKKWLSNHRFAYYAVIGVSILMCCGVLGTAYTARETVFGFAPMENNWHPDILTALPLVQTPRAGFPQYYVPRLDGLIFAATLQMVVDLVPAVQRTLSTKVLQIVFPHVFTIYLIHGLIWWSWGAWLLCVLTDRGYSYSLAMTVVGLTSYTLLAMSLPILTPVTEKLGRDLTHLWWVKATTKPPVKLRTLHPFPDGWLEGSKLQARQSGHDDTSNGDKDKSIVSCIAQTASTM